MTRLTRLRDAVHGWPAGWLLAPAVLLLVGLFVYPTLEIAKLSLFDPGFTTQHFARFFGTPVYLRVFLHTGQISLVVALGCFVLGYPAAYFIVRMPPRWRPYVLFLILVPLWMSILIRNYAWMVVLGRTGLINSLLLRLGLTAEPLKMLFTTEAVYLAMIQILLPIMILTCYGVMVEIDQGLLRAARGLGATPARAFLAVFVPLSLSGVATGGIIVFMLSMGFFITPALLGGRRDMMMANLISYQVSTTLNWGFAAAIALVLLVSTVAAVLLFRAVVRTPAVGLR